MNDEKELNELLDQNFPLRDSPKGEYRGHAISGECPPNDLKFSAAFTQWASSDGRIFIPTHTTQQKLTPGVYEIRSNPSIGLYFEKIPVRTENLLRFPDSNSNIVVDEIQRFWEREHLFKKHELIYKRGILLWGVPGGGKSCTVQLIMEDVVNRGGVVLRFTEPTMFILGMRALRNIQPETEVVVIMEDIDSIITQYCESDVLNLLDGVNEVHKCVFLATTNYPERLGKRIVNRPSRFDKRFKIGMPNAAARRMYFEHLFKGDTSGIDLDQWVKDTREFSIAHLKELFIAVVILGDNYQAAIKTLSNMKENINDRDGSVRMGFDSNSKEED